MGTFKKTDQIFAYLNITLQDSNLLLFRDRIPKLLSNKKRADKPPFVHIL